MAESPPPRLRVLLIAEACNPTWTSVPLVGYNFARALAGRDDLDVTLVSQVRNRAALEADPIASRARLHFIDNEWVARPLYLFARLLRGGESLSWTIDTAMGWPSYVAFEKDLEARFRRPLREGAFDLVHRVTPLSPTAGSPLASQTDVPMMIGPLNGGLPWPREYPELRRKEREWLVPLRGLYRRLPYYRSTYRHAAAVVAGSRHTASEVPRWFRGLRFYLPENGVDPARFPVASAWPEPRGRFRFLTVGRLVPYKGVDLILEAMGGSAALKGCELRVVGDGPERARLEGLARQYGLEGSVSFAGWVDQRELAREFAQSQAFAFPSLREFGGGVVLEALASGLPAVVVDYGGPGELVTPECGTLLALKPREELVPQLRRAMEELAGDPARCRALGAAACRRVREEFTWEAKAERIVGMYRQVLRARAGPGAEKRRPASNPAGG
jgi:glycosyltransferase involved in cell wall biosynthesis